MAERPPRAAHRDTLGMPGWPGCAALPYWYSNNPETENSSGHHAATSTHYSQPAMMCSATAKAFLFLLAFGATDAFSTPNPRSNSYHDYSRDPADGETNVDIGEINSLLSQRLDAKRKKRFRLADSIRDHLRTSFGVEIDDAALLWSASPGANFGRGRTSPRSGGPRAGNRQNRGSRFGPNGHDYQRTGGPMHASCQLSENEIHSLLAERLQCKLDRNYKKADNIQHMMWDAGVRIHDGRRQWRCDGGSFADDDGSDAGGRHAKKRMQQQRKKSAGCSKSPYSEPISREDEAYVSDLIEKRMEAKRIQNYETADGIKDELLNMMNVHIDDSLRSWSVGGNFGDNRRYFDGEEYFFVGDSDKVEPKTLGIIKKAIAKRSEYKRHRNYDEADNIRYRLRETFGISVDDKRKCYYFEKEFQVKKEKPKGQTRANTIDDSNNDHEEIPWGDEMEDEYGEEGGTFVEETSTDGSEKTPILVPVVDSYAEASGSDTSKLSAEDEAYISQRLSRRVEAWNERDFDTANAIEVELAMGFNVDIDDELGQWSIDAAADANAAEGRGSVGSTVTSTENEKAFVVGDDATGNGGTDRSTLESLTIPVLKEKLRERGLKVSGKKRDLIDRFLKYT